MAGDTQKTNVAPTPSFADVLRTNALKAMNIRSGAKGNGPTPAAGTTTRMPLPSPRSYADAGARRLAGGVRVGQALDNSVMTPPGSYSPFLTIQAQQTPNSRQMEYTYAQWWYTNEPRVAAAIDFYSTFPLSGFSLECGNPYVKEYFDDLAKKLNLQKWLPLVAHEYYLRGDVFVLASLDCKHCGGLSYDKKTGDPCNHDGATWSNLCILNPDRIEATPAMLGQEPTYYYLPNEDMKRVVTTGEPKHIYDSIPDELKAIIASDQPIYFNDVSLWHLKHGAAPFQNFGQSLVRRCFMTLAYKDKLRQAQWIIAERHILPIKVVKIGDKDRPASDEDLEAAQEQLANLANSPLYTIITHDAWEMDFVGATGKFATVNQEFEQIEQELLDGFMLNKGMLNGEGPSIQGAQIGLLIADRRLEQFRREVAYWLEERLFKPIALFNGFVEDGERGQEKPIYPTVKWDDLKLRDDTGKLQIIAQLQQQGIVDAQTLIEMLGLNYDQIVERLRYENAANSANSPGIIGGGYGGPLSGGGAGGGAMGGGAMGGGMPAMPPMGGAPPGGDGGMGGAPAPGGGGGMGMGPMASTDPEKNYRAAASVMHEVFLSQTDRHASAIGIRTASVTAKSDAHEGFLRSISAVTGRGVVGEIPSNMDEIFPLEEVGPTLGGYDAIPLNRAGHIAWAQTWSDVKEAVVAQREITAQAKGGKQALPPRMLFTKLEQELYKILGQENIPYALFAQYSAGPDQKYQLDAAFPALRLGIEADSEMYHNNPSKISNDRQRDMELASQGWTVLRFTEQEIHRQPHEIRAVVIQTIKKLMSRTNSGGAVL